MAKEIDFQEVQETQKVPKKLDPRKHTPRHTIITLPKMKDKGRILEAAREKEQLPTKGFPSDYQLISQKKPCRQGFLSFLAGKKGLERSIQSHERQGPTSKLTLSSKAII